MSPFSGGAWRLATAPAGELADRADQASHLHGLRQVLLETPVERLLAVLRARECGQRHRRQIALRRP